MKNNLQNISSGTLFASAIISLINLVIAIVGLLLPFLIIQIVEKGINEKNEWLIDFFSKLNLFSPGQIYSIIVGIIIFFISTILLYKAMKTIRGGVKIKKWSIIALLASLLLIYTSGNLAFFGGILGIIGSTTGLILSEGMKKK